MIPLAEAVQTKSANGYDLTFLTTGGTALNGFAATGEQLVGNFTPNGTRLEIGILYLLPQPAEETTATTEQPQLTSNPVELEPPVKPLIETITQPLYLIGIAWLILNALLIIIIMVVKRDGEEEDIFS